MVMGMTDKQVGRRFLPFKYDIAKGKTPKNLFLFPFNSSTMVTKDGAISKYE